MIFKIREEKYDSGSFQEWEILVEGLLLER